MASGEQSLGLATPDMYEIDDAPSPTSDYSSCNESDFDKYCSANSVLGTASVCSSSADCTEFSDLESELLRNAQDGEDKTKEKLMFSDNALEKNKNRLHSRFNRRNLTVSGSRELDRGLLGRSSDPYSGEMVSTATISQNHKQKRYNEQDFKDLSNLTRMIGGHHSPTSVSDKSPSPSDGEADEVKELSPDCFLTDKGSNCIQHFSSSPVKSDIRLIQEDHNHGAMLETFVYGKDKGVVSMDDENTYKYGSLVGEESDLDSGTDDENKTFIYSRRDLPHQEERASPLLMNTAVAFGSEDWNEFMMDRGESDNFSFGRMNPLRTEESSLGVPAKDAFGKAIGDFVSFPNQTGSYDTTEFMLPAKPQKGVVGMLFASPVSHGTDDEYCIQKYSSAETTASNHHDMHFKCHMDARNFSEGNLLIEGDSPSCQIVKENDTVDVEAPVGVRRPFSSQDSGVACVAKPVKLFQCYSTEEPGSGSEISKEPPTGLSGTLLNVLSAVRVLEPITTAENQDQDTESHGVHESSKSTTSMELLMTESKQCFQPENLSLDEFVESDLSESYDDMVQDMEAVLLGSAEHYGDPRSDINSGVLFQRSQPYRDGSSTASTSGGADVYHPNQLIKKIDWIEVVGAKQKRGDVSPTEWLVGTKEYTVYTIRMWSGENQWEVERRYRDFFTLYRQLKTFFSNHGLMLPSPWTKVEPESRKIFGNASPDVISERSSLIQECLRSILYAETDIGIHASFFRFLSDKDAHSDLLCASASFPRKILGSDHGTLVSRDACASGVHSLGKTISLIVEMHPKKSLKQLLESQHLKCAGCYKHLEVKKSIMQEVAQTLGWGKPRLCEYTGQLFCSDCHSNETAILPARVLQHWDFSFFPVSQLAKSYLDSIYDKPMLCVSAVNPILFSKVPSLLHIMAIRKKIATMIECVRCPFHRSVQRGLGSRKYILENNDFFALRDLVDLSKGAFAALPVMMENLSRKTMEHITQQCLICCDVGEMCGARSACDDPSSLIFPFQESETAHCSSCGLFFHDHCFKKLTCCPCNTSSQPIARADLNFQEDQRGNEFERVSDLSPRPLVSRSATTVLSNLFAKVKLENPLRRKSDNVILMGSL